MTTLTRTCLCELRSSTVRNISILVHNSRRAGTLLIMLLRHFHVTNLFDRLERVVNNSLFRFVRSSEVFKCLVNKGNSNVNRYRPIQWDVIQNGRLVYKGRDMNFVACRTMGLSANSYQTRSLLRKFRHFNFLVFKSAGDPIIHRGFNNFALRSLYA